MRCHTSTTDEPGRMDSVTAEAEQRLQEILISILGEGDLES